MHTFITINYGVGRIVTSFFSTITLHRLIRLKPEAWRCSNAVGVQFMYKVMRKRNDKSKRILLDLCMYVFPVDFQVFTHKLIMYYYLVATFKRWATARRRRETRIGNDRSDDTKHKAANNGNNHSEARSEKREEQQRQRPHFLISPLLVARRSTALALDSPFFPNKSKQVCT